MFDNTIVPTVIAVFYLDIVFIRLNTAIVETVVSVATFHIDMLVLPTRKQVEGIIALAAINMVALDTDGLDGHTAGRHSLASIDKGIVSLATNHIQQVFASPADNGHGAVHYGIVVIIYKKMDVERVITGLARKRKRSGCMENRDGIVAATRRYGCGMFHSRA
jgi:hypothetical protein